MDPVKRLQGALIGLCVAIFAALGVGFWAWKTSGELTSTRAENSRLLGDLASRDKVISGLRSATQDADKAAVKAALHKKAAKAVEIKTMEKVEDALSRNEDWASKPIPEGVLNALR